MLTLINARLGLKSSAHRKNGCVKFPLLQYVVFTAKHLAVPLQTTTACGNGSTGLQFLQVI